MKLQRNWDHFPTRDTATENSMRAAQRKALFELLRDLTEYAKANPSCRVKNLRFDPIGTWGAIGVEMESIHLDNATDVDGDQIRTKSTMKPPSDTPRTDAAHDATLNPDYEYVGAENEAWAFARKLEREINALKAELALIVHNSRIDDTPTANDRNES